jgi:ADP-ribose pyrophosphatase YjhB (NUDIX family)
MKIVVHSPVIIEKDKLLVTLDSEDQFYKLPGGKKEEKETGTQACIRKMGEDTGLEIEIEEELPVIRLNYDLRSGKPTNIELHHYIARLTKKQKKFVSYNFKGHEVRWLPISEIKEGRHEIAPNIRMLIERGDIK